MLSIHAIHRAKIPLHRLSQPGGQVFLRTPAKLALDLANVHRVAPVVPWAVGDEANQAGVRGGGVNLGINSSRMEHSVWMISRLAGWFPPPML